MVHTQHFQASGFVDQRFQHRACQLQQLLSGLLDEIPPAVQFSGGVRRPAPSASRQNSRSRRRPWRSDILMVTTTGAGWPPSAVCVFGRTARTPQDGRGRPSYALLTRESFVAERRGNVWRRRHTSLGRPIVWRWFDRRSATRWFGGMAPPRRMGGNPRRPSVRRGGLCDQGQEPKSRRRGWVCD